MPTQADHVKRTLDQLFRRQAGQLTATLARIFGPGRLDLAENVVQEALIAAMQTWPFKGIPANPAGWLLRVARNKALDVIRHQNLCLSKEAELCRFLAPADGLDDGPAGAALAAELRDDQLRLLFTCCHPALARDAQLALALKTLFGFGVREIAAAFLAQESAVAQRLVRAKARLADAEAQFDLPDGEPLEQRVGAVLETLYLVFSEGYNTHGGDRLVREDVCREALRITGLLTASPVGDRPAAHALLAMMCFHASRLGARTDAAGDLVLLSEQDRGRWDHTLIGQGVGHLAKAATGEQISVYHLQAGIAACHALAPSSAGTDWAQIVAYYDDLLAMSPSPIVAINRAAAVAMRDGPRPGLKALRALKREPRLAGYYLLHGVEGELRARLGEQAEAAACYRMALTCLVNAPERRFLQRRLAAAEGQGQADTPEHPEDPELPKLPKLPEP